VSLFQLDLDVTQIERSKTESERHQMFGDAEDLDDAEAYARRRSRRPATESEPSSRSGFNGSLPVDEELQKLVSLTSPTQGSNGHKDWKQSTRDRLRANTQAQSMELLPEHDDDDDDSSNDEGMSKENAILFPNSHVQNYASHLMISFFHVSYGSTPNLKVET
jgi:hypothetical protein